MSGTTTGPVGGGSGAGVQVHAHRGFHGVNGISENSLAAFRAAIDVGADVIELDVRRTRDGVLVVHHDARLRDGRKIADLDHAQLPALRDGQPIPTLAQVAQLVRERGSRMSVELKEKGHEREAAFVLAANVPMSQVEIMSFNQGSIAELERFDPSIRTGLLAPRIPGALRDSWFMPAATWTMDAFDWHPSLRAAQRVGADFVSAYHGMATNSFVDSAHRRGLEVYAWTVDDPRRMALLVQRGVDGIVTDRPDLAVHLPSRTTTGAHPHTQEAAA